MNQKDRIIELVKQGIITIDEALDLLEDLNDETMDARETILNKNEGVVDQISDVVEEATIAGTKWVHDVINEVTSSEVTSSDENKKENIDSVQEDMDQTIEEIASDIKLTQDRLDSKKEAFVIVEQRLREYEIFKELDELTPEMKDNQISLMEKREKLSQEIKDLDSVITRLKQEQRKWRENEWKQYSERIKEKFEDVTDNASDLTDQAIERSRNMSQYLRENIQDILSGVQMREIDFTIPLPWLKKKTIEHRFTFDATEISKIHFYLWKGSVDIVSTEQSEIIVDSKLHFYGKAEDASVNKFKESNYLSVFEELLEFKVISPLMTMDATIYLPNKVYESIQIELLNGNLDVSNIRLKEGKIIQKKGNIALRNIEAEEMDIDVIIGDVIVKQSKIANLKNRNMKGEFRLIGYVGKLTSKTLYANCFITKTNSDLSVINMNNMTGDIKLSLPDDSSFEIDCEVNFGQIYNRLKNVRIIEAEGNKELKQFIRDDIDESSQIKLQTTTGDIYLKDFQ